MKFVVYGINILCMSEQELHLLLPYSNVTFHGRLSGVFMGVRTGDGTWCRGGEM